MNEDEAVGDYFSRVMNNVGQQRSYGEELTDQKIVEKILRSLSPKFDYVIPSIEVTFELSEVTLVKLMGLLQSQEERINFRLSLGKPSKGLKVAKTDQKEETNEEEEHHLLMVSTIQNDKKERIWFMDSGDSNHMISSLENFIEMNESFKSTVKLGDKKPLKVEGKGTVIMFIEGDDFKVLENVYYVPSLEYNLLSVGQFMRKGYSVLFEDGFCSVRNNSTRKRVIRAPVANNNMFMVDSSFMLTIQNSPAVRNDAEALKWHYRFGHLHFGGMKQLYDHNMVQGLPRINQNFICESCITCK
ncbi:uncharacterized protein LOC143555801 [Bidens hawaiensis]|uniref:uncharacterized protein LOC143555801 n=1 Tax=Bidens hawaiensis TaxID=980011 RepID=UPI0040497774